MAREGLGTMSVIVVVLVLQLHISISRRGGEEDSRSSNIMVRGGSCLIIA